MRVFITNIHNSHGISFRLILVTENTEDTQTMAQLNKCLSGVDEDNKLYVTKFNNQGLDYEFDFADASKTHVLLDHRDNLAREDKKTPVLVLESE